MKITKDMLKTILEDYISIYRSYVEGANEDPYTIKDASSILENIDTNPAKILTDERLVN